MSKTLNLVDGLLDKARHLHELGRSQDALPILRRLSRFSSLSCEVECEIQQLLGEACLEMREFRLARKHLRRALRLEPGNCLAHHLLALAIQNDAEADSALASRHHRRALELAPNSPDFLAAAGAFFADIGQTKKGIELLRRAWQLAPDDLDILKALVESLSEKGEFDDARRTVNAARFGAGRDGRIAAIAADLEMREQRDRQRQGRPASPFDRMRDPVILPFVGVVPGEPKPVRAYRRDAARSRIQRPHLLRRYDAEQA